MMIRQLFDKESSTFTYLLVDQRTQEAVLIDPVREQVERDLALIHELGAKLVYVMETHIHADHVTAASTIKSRTGAATVASIAGATCADLQVRHGDTIRVGDQAVTVLATPGHTDDSISFRCGDAVFTGDALLIRSCGRTDFQNGDAGTLYDSLTKLLFQLPDDVVVYPAHDYRGFSSTTIGEEKKYNSRAAGRTRAEFVALMEALDLPRPKQIDVAVPANRACGRINSGLWSEARAHAEGFREAGPDAVHARVGAVRVVDVREPEEFSGELGHVKCAELVPLGELTRAAARWDKDTELVVVCRSGKRSARAAGELVRAGFAQVVNLSGGMLAWNEEGLPVERERAAQS